MLKGPRGSSYKLGPADVKVQPCETVEGFGEPDNEAAEDELRRLLAEAVPTKATTRQARLLKAAIDESRPWLPACVLAEGRQYSAAQPLKNGIRFQLAVLASHLYRYFGTYGLDAFMVQIKETAKSYQHERELETRLAQIRETAMRMANGPKDYKCLGCGRGDAIDGVAAQCQPGLSTFDAILATIDPQKREEAVPNEPEPSLKRFCTRPPSTSFRPTKRRGSFLVPEAGRRRIQSNIF